jgi:hypothetical protein
MAAVCVFCAASAAFAEPAEFVERYSPVQEEVVLPRALAMGEAFVAVAQKNTGYFYNPAGIAQETLFNIGVDSSFDFTGDNMSFAASVLDSITSPLCAQIGYAYNGFTGIQLWNESDWGWLKNTPTNADYYLMGNRDTRDVEYNYSLLDEGDVDDYRRVFGQFKRARNHRHVPRIALAGAINRYFMLGVTAKYIYAQRPGRHDVNSGNVDIGMMIDTGIGLKIGLTAYNLIHSAYDLWPLKLAGGLSYSYEGIFTIAYDTVVVFDVFKEKEPYDLLYKYPEGVRLAYRVGAEFVAGGIVAIRAGYQYDEAIDNMFVSGGLAYVDDIWSIGAAYKQGLWDKKNRLMSIGFEVQVP